MQFIMSLFWIVGLVEILPDLVCALIGMVDFLFSEKGWRNKFNGNVICK